MTDEKMVTITEKRYKELLSDEEFLNALFAVGVDSWEGYEDAQDMVREK